MTVYIAKVFRTRTSPFPKQVRRIDLYPEPANIEDLAPGALQYHCPDDSEVGSFYCYTKPRSDPKEYPWVADYNPLGLDMELVVQKVFKILGDDLPRWNRRTEYYLVEIP